MVAKMDVMDDGTCSGEVIIELATIGAGKRVDG